MSRGSVSALAWPWRGPGLAGWLTVLSTGCGAAAPAPTPAVSSSAAAPRAPSAEVRFATVHTGGAATCAVTREGRAACWGAASEGLIGDGQQYAKVGVRPSPVWLEEPRAVRDIGVGVGTAVALTQGGALYTWGRHVVGRSEERFASRHIEETYWKPRRGPAIANAVSVSSGDGTFFAVDQDGTGWGWGYGGNFVLGGLRETAQQTPAPIEGLLGVTQISSFGGYSCGLGAQGTVACWGTSGGRVVGELPTLELTDADLANRGSSASLSEAAAAKLWDALSRHRLSPVRGVVGATQIDVSASHGCALLADARVVCWGAGKSYQLGHGQSVGESGAVLVSGITDAVAVAAGTSQSCALRQTGEVWCWGLILDKVTAKQPRRIEGLSNIEALSLSDQHGCAIDQDAGLWCWGGNRSGQLGLGTVSVEEPPTRVTAPEPARPSPAPARP